MTDRTDPRFRTDPRNGGEDNRPRALPPVDQLFAVVMWLREHGWCTVAWTMTRGDADDIAALYLAKPHYTRSEVWYRGDPAAAVEKETADRSPHGEN